MSVSPSSPPPRPSDDSTAAEADSLEVLVPVLPRAKWHWGMPVLYPNHYAWYVLVSFLDVMLTVKLLLHLGAREVNTIAQFSIELFGTWGLIGLKTLSMVVVVLICEFVGRRQQPLGRKIAVMAIAVSLIPVTSALTQVAVFSARGDLEWIDHPINEDTGYPIEP